MSKITGDFLNPNQDFKHAFSMPKEAVSSSNSASRIQKLDSLLLNNETKTFRLKPSHLKQSPAKIKEEAAEEHQTPAFKPKVEMAKRRQQNKSVAIIPQNRFKETKLAEFEHKCNMRNCASKCKEREETQNKKDNKFIRLQKLNRLKNQLLSDNEPADMEI